MDYLWGNFLLKFRISYEDVPTVLHYPIAPVNFKLFNMMKIEIPWHSDPFPEGYQMCLKVYVSGNGNGAGSHVSIYLFLMKGPYDDELQ